MIRPPTGISLVIVIAISISEVVLTVVGLKVMSADSRVPGYSATDAEVSVAE